MIPRRLRMRNFLSYREGDVSFTGLHVAVLCGKNGEGKSSLLDAITWALWGEARGRVEDDRIHLGEREMLVDLTFEANGGEYRVLRKRTRTRSGALEFFQLDEHGRQVPLTGGTIRETQAEIDRRVGMDYTTFVNSAFIAQGRADEFTRKSPSDRKEVLRKVLGLERYEELSRRARERKSVDSVELAARERWLADAAGEVAQMPQVEAALLAIETEAALLIPRLEKADAEVRDLSVAANERKARQQAVDDLASQATRLRTSLGSSREAIQRANEGLEATAAVLERADEVGERFAQLQALRTEEEKCSRQAATARAFEGEISGLVTVIAREESALAARRDDGAGRIEALRATAAGLDDLMAEETALAREHDGTRELAEEAERARGIADAKRAEAAEYQGRAAEAKTRALDLKADEARLAGAERLCPVCRQPLSVEDAARVAEESRAERKRLGDQHRELVECAARAAEEAALAERAEKDTVARRKDCEDGLRARERSLHTRLDAARSAAAEAVELERALATVVATLEREAFATEQRAALLVARERLAGVGYDAAVHEDLRRRLTALGDAENAFREVQVAREREASLKAVLQREQDTVTAVGAELLAVEERLSAAREQLAATVDVAERFAAAEAQLAELRETQQQIHGRRGALVERLETLKRREAEAAKIRDEASAIQEDVQLHGELVEAFGRNGVQAMLIDQSIPEIERVANDMLERMTGGRIEVRLSTRRESATGLRDTLDILIADDLGVRDYEMYSGGESFRVDFALRIALSHVLAARAGAALPTLIIDEGFGSQDAEGVDRLVDAINAIQQDYRLILIVTHLEDLRERFERRIEVTKDALTGSHAVVV